MSEFYFSFKCKYEESSQVERLTDLDEDQKTRGTVFSEAMLSVPGVKGWQ